MKAMIGDWTVTDVVGDELILTKGGSTTTGVLDKLNFLEIPYKLKRGVRVRVGGLYIHSYGTEKIVLSVEGKEFEHESMMYTHPLLVQVKNFQIEDL